jgi:hypothetical protein
MRSEPCMARSRISLVLATAAVALVPALAVGAFAVDDTNAAEACPEKTMGDVEQLPRVDWDLLQDLHARFAHLPGLVDVYYYPGDDVEYRPMFVAHVPSGAQDVQTPVPVSFDVIPERPRPAPAESGPGLLPDLDDTLCGGIRPGSRLAIGGGICTANFIFRDATDTYIGTAGHCTNVGDSALVSGVGIIGTTVYSTGDGGTGTDFALIRVNANRLPLVSAEMCHWAGPTGSHLSGGILGRRILHTGHGLGSVHAPPRPKVGAGVGFGAQTITWAGSAIFGDSGSAARLDGGVSVGTVGLAAGVVTHITLVPPGLNFGTNMPRIFQLTQNAGFNVQLETVAYTHLH